MGHFPWLCFFFKIRGYTFFLAEKLHVFSISANFPKDVLVVPGSSAFVSWIYARALTFYAHDISLEVTRIWILMDGVTVACLQLFAAWLRLIIIVYELHQDISESSFLHPTSTTCSKIFVQTTSNSCCNKFSFFFSDQVPHLIQSFCWSNIQSFIKRFIY